MNIMIDVYKIAKKKMLYMYMNKGNIAQKNVQIHKIAFIKTKTNVYNTVINIGTKNMKINYVLNHVNINILIHQNLNIINVYNKMNVNNIIILLIHSNNNLGVNIMKL